MKFWDGFKRYCLNVLVWIDQGVNVIFFLGDPDETISSRTGKWAVKGSRIALVAEKIIDFIFGKGHCRREIEPYAGQESVIFKD